VNIDSNRIECVGSGGCGQATASLVARDSF
jgi:hypothetical protein